MRYEFNDETEKQYIEVLPSVAVSWWGRPTVMIGWLFWNIVITF